MKFLNKIKKLTLKRIWELSREIFILGFLRNTWLYYYLYKSYWYSLKTFKINNKKKNKNYLSINVDSGAGIGHQLANYNAGIWYSKKFKLFHAHTSFPNNKWEKTLGFKHSIINTKDILNKNYKIIKLPLFNEKNLIEISKIKKIIHSYSSQKVIFFLETNQPYKNQYEVTDYLKKNFFLSKERKKDIIMFDDQDVNIAVHIRLPMIIEDVIKRYNDADYKLNIINQSFNMLESFLNKFQTKKKISIYIFTQFYDSDLKVFNKFSKVNYCYKISPYKSFINFIYADVLITSKSSFSYKAALISRGIKVSPSNFWHGYPREDKKWFLVNNDGKFKKNIKKIVIK